MQNYEFSAGIFDRRRKLILTDDYIEFENKDLRGQEFTRIYKNEIIDFKHGANSIIWYKFYVGSEYSMSIKHSGKVDLNIKLRSYFNNRAKYARIYASIVKAVQNFCVENIFNQRLHTYRQTGELQLSQITITTSGVKRLHGPIIPWSKVTVVDYKRYFTIFNSDIPEQHCVIPDNEYESELIWFLIAAILKQGA